MSDSDTPSPRVRAGVVRTVSVVCIVISLLFVIVCSGGYLARRGAKTVDFNDTIADTGDSGVVPGEDQAVLHVAVAAMISPQVTKQCYEDLLRVIGDSVGRQVTFLQRKTYTEVNDLLEHKEIDVAFVCSGPYVAGHKQFGMEILAVPVVNGGTVYHSYILAQRDSAITCFDDLKGKRFAFTDPKSNTGYLVPKFMLAQRGQSPEEFFGEISFTYSHDNSIKAVAEDVADGAAVDHLIWEFFAATDPVYTSRTKIVEKSPPYGIPPVVVHPQLAADLKHRLRAAFLSLHERPESVPILKRLRIERFAEGNDSSYDSVREMEAWLADHQSSDTGLPGK